jgi:hypothetical protein
MDNKAPILTDDQVRQMEFVKTILGGIEGHLHYLINVKGKIPAEWDHVELRQFLADYAAECNFVKMPRGRKMSYKNTRMINGF